MKLTAILIALGMAVVCFLSGAKWCQIQQRQESNVCSFGGTPEITYWAKVPPDSKIGDLLRFDGKEWRKVGDGYTWVWEPPAKAIEPDAPRKDRR